MAGARPKSIKRSPLGSGQLEFLTFTRTAECSRGWLGQSSRQWARTTALPIHKRFRRPASLVPAPDRELSINCCSQSCRFRRLDILEKFRRRRTRPAARRAKDKNTQLVSLWLVAICEHHVSDQYKEVRLMTIHADAAFTKWCMQRAFRIGSSFLR